MRSRTNDAISARQVEELAGGIIEDALRLVDHGYKCTVRVILLVLFFAASRATSIFDACQRLRRAPTDQAIRDGLLGQLPGMTELERRLNRGLQAKLPKGLFRKSRPMAIDISEICYYGKPWRRKRELRRSKRKQGTLRFHCYATLYVVRRGERFTIALTYVWKDDSHVEVVRRLLERARAIGLRPRYLLLDRGFYGVDVVEYLKSAHCPFLMPVVHRGRRSKKPLSQLKSTRRFLAWKRSGWSTQMMKNREKETRVNICVWCRPKKKLRPLVFAFWGFRPSSPSWAREEYRKRYGIETSYRQMNQGRIRTCSRDPRLRLLIVGIALILRNVWVWLHRSIFGRTRGRGIELHLECLRLRTMLLILQRCAEACLHCAEVVQLPLQSLLPAASGP
jgi:hypothetical protein